MNSSPSFPRLTRALFLFLLVVAVAFPLMAQPQNATLRGRVADSSGAIIPQASIQLRSQSTGAVVKTTSGMDGSFELHGLAAGNYELTVSSESFSPQSQPVKVVGSDNQVVAVTLSPAGLVEQVNVIATHIVGTEEMSARIPGSVEVIGTELLESTRVMQFGEALRKVAGVNVREEEGFGLRPNIGIRGLNPTRSSKVLLLEDGVPLAYAPYGDNASYYHPPVERFASIEVMKGAGQILYGPVTVGGVVNYVTPDPPKTTSGNIQLTGGSRNYLNGQGSIGTTIGRTGLMVDYMRKQGEGSRENLRFGLNDLNFKATTNVANHYFILKTNYYTEDSNVSYSGLRQAEYAADPRSNPFRNDFFYGDRFGGSINHSYVFGNGLMLNTNVYGSSFMRDWWRQSSNSGQRPNDASDPACGGMANLNTTCGNEGRLRGYYSFGIDPHVRANYAFAGMRHETDLGFRFHMENQDRLQKNGDTPTARDGRLVESNVRRNVAYSAFAQNRFAWKRLAITPGVRVERIFMERRNRLNNAQGDTDLTQVVPGLGVSVAATDNTTIFAGVHRGFAPPRPEDVVNNTTGGVIDLDPELSWNYEFGIRTAPVRGLRMDATFFRSDYENQIVAASLAGGVGASLTNGGQTLHQGFEASSRVDTGVMFGHKHNVYARTSYTWLPLSRFEGTRFSNIGGFSTVNVSGNRLPYSPEHLLNLMFGYNHPTGFEAVMEANYVGDQFADDLNTVAPTADGQRGLLPSNTLWNATLNYHAEQIRSTFYFSVKNLFDKTVIVDRARGILPNHPRLVQAGVKYSF